MRRHHLKILLLTIIAFVVVSARLQMGNGNTANPHPTGELVEFNIIDTITSFNDDSVCIGIWGDRLENLGFERYIGYNVNLIRVIKNQCYSEAWTYHASDDSMAFWDRFLLTVYKTEKGLLFKQVGMNFYDFIESDGSLSCFQEETTYSNNEQATEIHTGKFKRIYNDRKLNSINDPLIEMKEFQQVCKRNDTLTVARFSPRRRLKFMPMVVTRTYKSARDGKYYMQEYSQTEYYRPDEEVIMTPVETDMRFDYKDKESRRIGYTIYHVADSTLVFYRTKDNMPFDTLYWVYYDYFTSDVDSNIYLGNNGENH